jgi:hypothetical protein
MKNIIFLTSLIIVIFACRSNKQRGISNAEYVEIAFDSIEFYSIHKNTYNFDSLKSNILMQINDSTKRLVVIELLNYAIDEVDIHSYILTKEQYKRLETGKAQPNTFAFQGEMIDGKYALLTLEGFQGVDGLAKVAVQYSADTFVVNQTLVLRINICGENRHLRQAANR